MVFDLDGLVLDSERCYFRCWQKAAEDMGFELSETQYCQVIGIPNEHAEKMLAAMLGAAFSESEFSIRWNAYWNELLDRHKIPPKPGLLELLELLDSCLIPRAIATSSLKKDAMRSLGPLAERFTVIVSREMVEHGKPAPDLFLLAAERLGVPPNRCLVLEDSEAGVFAAVAAGMPVILVPDMSQPCPEVISKAWRLCESLHEVAQLLRTLSPCLG